MHSNGQRIKPLRINGGGFVSSSPEPTIKTQRIASDHVYNSMYKGPTYAVKYLGIVDGAMGILSRKMALGPA